MKFAYRGTRLFGKTSICLWLRFSSFLIITRLGYVSRAMRLGCDEQGNQLIHHGAFWIVLPHMSRVSPPLGWQPWIWREGKATEIFSFSLYLLCQSVIVKEFLKYSTFADIEDAWPKDLLHWFRKHQQDGQGNSQDTSLTFWDGPHSVCGMSFSLNKSTSYL